jgi:hypothetical protein
MTLGIRELLGPALRDRSTRFVFPSEICAEAWLAEALGMGVGAIESERFLGWDRLKQAAAGPEGRKASDDYLRRIFAADLLAGNASEPFLSSIVPPGYAELWQPFAGYLASRLPALGRLPEALETARARGAGRSGGGAGPAAADWLEVRRRYEGFLRGIGRYEPAYEPRSLRAPGGTTIIFFPELIEDFEEYRATLESAPGIRLAPLPDERPRGRLRRPETALAELRGVLAEAGKLLDGGLEAERIAITVAGLDAYRPYLEREARLLSIPLAIKSGSSLASTSGGRLFAAIRGAHSSGFSYDAMRDLVMSPAWPWKDATFGRSLLSEGRRLHAVAPWTEGGKMADAWERSLGGGSLRDSYRKLRRRASELVSAADFKSIIKAYNAFKAEFLSPDRGNWDTGADLTLARCVVELQALAGAQAESGLKVEGAFGLFMRTLEEKPYVGSAAGAGIPVYEWRVAAGILPKRHFVLGASQDALAVPAKGFDFLGEELREELGQALRGDRPARDDSGPDFISAYALSGDEVSFSCPRAGFTGEMAAHGFLSTISGEDESEAPRDGAYRDEAAWLSGRGSAPARLHAVQALGIAAAAEVSPAPRADGAFLEGRAAALASRRLYREGESRASLDSSAVDAYLACPFAYLYLRLLDAGPEASGIDFVDALFIGEVYHEALALLFERIREADGRFRAERVSDYAALVGECLGEAFAALARKRGAFVGVVLEAYRGRLEPCLRALLAAEAERFPSLQVGSVESSFELEYPLADFPEVPGGVVLRGRVDRVSLSEAGAVIVDYKKSHLPSRAQVSPDEAGGIAEAQMPCYVRLVAGAEGEGKAGVESAWYVSVEGDGRRGPGSAACAFAATPAAARGEKSPYVAGEGLAPLLAAFDRALRDTARGVFAGAFPLAPKESQSIVCADCGARGICRERYAIRFGVEGRPA